jgi:predicted PurR-regulated permease PerM
MGRRLAWLAGALVAGILIWRLADVLLMAFGAILVAILLQALAAPLVRRLRWSRPLALSAAVFGLSAAIAGALWLFGHQILLQIEALTDLVPRAWGAIQTSLSGTPLGAYILDDLQRLQHADGLVVQTASRLLQGSATAVAATVIVLFAGLYLAFHPDTYLRGVLRLFPLHQRLRAGEIFAACGDALNRWLLGQLYSMLLVGVSVGLGLWLVGAPSPLALGVMAGLAQFVPVVGPMAATIPGLIVAAGVGPETLAWTAAIYLGASQLEANLVTPLLLRQMVEVPMAVTLFAVLAMGVLLGPLGVLFATPLTVVVYVVVRLAYVEGVLGDRLGPPMKEPAS